MYAGNNMGMQGPSESERSEKGVKAEGGGTEMEWG